MKTRHCGAGIGWHVDSGYERGHTYGLTAEWCIGNEPEQLYTIEQAVILGRRALCESSDRGHDIQRAGNIVIKNANGTIAQYGYGCANCDLIVSTSYPPLVPAPHDA